MIDLSPFITPPPPPLAGQQFWADAINNTGNRLYQARHQRKLEEHAEQELAMQQQQMGQHAAETQARLGLQGRSLDLEAQKQSAELARVQQHDLEGAMARLAEANSLGDPVGIDAAAQELARRGFGVRGTLPSMQPPAQGPAPQQQPTGRPAPAKKPSALDRLGAGGMPAQLEQMGKSGGAFDTTIIPTRDPLQTTPVQTVGALRQQSGAAAQPSASQAPPTQETAPAQQIPQQSFIAPPLPGMPLTPPIGPRDPAHGTGYEVFDLQSGKTLGHFDHTALRQYQEQKVRESFAPYVQASDPLEREIAQQVQQSTLGQLGTGEPLDKIINGGLSYYQHRLGTESQSRRHRVAGAGGGGAPGVSKMDFERGKALAANTLQQVRTIESGERYATLAQDEAFVKNGLGLLEGKGGTTQGMALNSLVHKYYGANSSDREFDRIFSSSGYYNTALAELNKYTKGGVLPDEMKDQLREAFRTGQQQINVRKKELAQKAYNAASGSAKSSFGANDEEASIQGDIGQQYITGKFEHPSNVVPRNAKAEKQGVLSRSKPTKETPTVQPKKEEPKGEDRLRSALDRVEQQVGIKRAAPAKEESPDDKRKREARERARRALGGL